MVKLTGPGLAKQAGGTLAGQLVFSSWKGRAYVKTKSTPTQPRTDPQMAMRNMLTFLSQEWANLTQPQQDAWDAVPVTEPIPAFNKYQKVNLQRYRSFLAPSIIYPITETGTSPAEANWTVTCLGDHARINVQIAAPNDGWGVAFYRKVGWGPAFKWSDVLHVQHLCGYCWHHWDFYPDESATYVFGFHTFTTDGKLTRPDPKTIAQCILTV